MRLREIVSCWVSHELPADTNLAHVKGSLENAGFRTVKGNGGGRTRLKRGASLGATLDYDSQALEVQVIVEQRRDGRNWLHVGNWGFPFEPLLMKKRFGRLAERLASDIREHGRVIPLHNEPTNVHAEVRSVRQSALHLLIGALAAGLILAAIRLL